MIVATGVVSLGAVRPETLSMIIDHLAAIGLIALCFNDPTSAEGSYDHVFEHKIALGCILVISQQHSPHFQQQKIGSDVIVLRRL